MRENRILGGLQILAYFLNINNKMTCIFSLFDITCFLPTKNTNFP